MYFFTMYNLSGRQAGIQAGHAAMRYALTFGFNAGKSTSAQETKAELVDFLTNHETFIILDGGTSSTMLDRARELAEMEIPFSVFHEPDLNNSLSAIAFILHEDEYAPSEDEIFYKTNPVYEYIRKFRLANN